MMTKIMFDVWLGFHCIKVLRGSQTRSADMCIHFLLKYVVKIQPGIQTSMHVIDQGAIANNKHHWRDKRDQLFCSFWWSMSRPTLVNVKMSQRFWLVERGSHDRSRQVWLGHRLVCKSCNCEHVDLLLTKLSLSFNLLFSGFSGY